MDRRLSRNEFHKMFHEDPDMRPLFHQWLKHLILSAATRNSSRDLERTRSYDCSDNTLFSKYNRSHSQVLEKSFREFSASFKCEVEEPSTCMTPTMDYDSRKSLMKDTLRKPLMLERVKETSGPYGDVIDHSVQTSLHINQQTNSNRGTPKKPICQNVERKPEKTAVKLEPRVNKPSAIHPRQQDAPSTGESKLFEAAGTLQNQTALKLVERRFRLGDHVNVQAIVADAKDRRLKSICERFNCQISIYSVKRSSGSIAYVLLVQALDEESVIKCVRCIDNTLKWDLFGQLKSTDANRRCVTKVVSG